MCKAIDKNLFAVFLPIQENWPFGCFFQNFGPVLSDFFTWIIGGRVRQRSTLGNFQCRDVLLFWIIVGRTLLAVGEGTGCLDYHLPLFLSFHID